MKIQSTILITTGVILSLLLTGWVWASASMQTFVTSYAFVSPNPESGIGCSTNVLDVSVHGNKTRLLLQNHGLMVSQDPRVTGASTVNVEVFIHNVSGHVTGHGSFVLAPDGYDGTWQADFNLEFPGGKSVDLNGLMTIKDSQMNARGNGVFEGQWFFFEHLTTVSPPPYDIPVTDPDGDGGCDFAGEIWNGKILNPNAG